MAHMATVTRTSGDTLMNLLKRHRLAMGLTQTALAKRVGVVPSTVCFWESGRWIPKPHHFPTIARVLGIDPLELTRVIEPEKQPAAA